MPEYLAPGVYVEEVNMTPTPIPGVPTKTLDPATAARLVAAIRPIMAEMQPAWTDHNDADPGMTLIQLFAWTTEALLYRSSPEFERRRSAVRRAVHDVTLAIGDCAKDDETLKRPRFFTGQLLDAATLQREQDYHRDKSRRHNLHLHGFGIVSGLEVRVDATSCSSGPRIVVEPGYAVDRCGYEVTIGRCVNFAPPPPGDAVFISVRQWDRPYAPSPVADSIVSGLLEEVCLIAVATTIASPGVALARLFCIDGNWTLDPTFAPPRVD